MAVGVIDVGSNSVRLLVATLRRGSLAPICEERTRIGLGDDVERFGVVSTDKLTRLTRAAHEFGALARAHGVERLEVLVTAPGRQSANARELLGALGAATGVPVRALSAEEEGLLAYEGAAAGLTEMPKSLAVCDIGGGSTEAVVGSRDEGPVWFRSFDIGAVRLTRRCLGSDPPATAELAEARKAVESSLGRSVPPVCERALATGGTARSLRRIVGERLGLEELDEAVKLVTAQRSRAVAREFGVDRRRARLLPAGVLILAAIQQRLVVPVEVASTGLREAAALRLLAERAAA